MNTIGKDGTVFTQYIHGQKSQHTSYLDDNSYIHLQSVSNGLTSEQPIGLNDTIPLICSLEGNFLNYMLSAFFCNCQSYYESNDEQCNQITDNEIDSEKYNGINLLSTELITKLFRDHSIDMEKAKRQVFAELDSYPNGYDIVFNNKTKAIKNPSNKGDKFRGSNYRGVSANGKSWQVFIVINKCKCYAGCVEKEEKAASIYDRLAIIFHGLKAKTNFSYTKSEVLLCYKIANEAKNRHISNQQ